MFFFFNLWALHTLGKLSATELSLGCLHIRVYIVCTGTCTLVYVCVHARGDPRLTWRGLAQSPPYAGSQKLELVLRSGLAGLASSSG